MAELEVFREFIKERLSIEALQIFGAVENTFSECKDDGARLDVKPEINLHFTGFIFNINDFNVNLLLLSVRSAIHVAQFHTMNQQTV